MERCAKKGYFWTYPTISFIIFWDYLMFYQIFLSPQVKQWAIITYKHGIYQFPQELPNHLRLRIPGNSEISGKCTNPTEWYPAPSPPPRQNKKLPNTSKKAPEKWRANPPPPCTTPEQNQIPPQIPHNRPQPTRHPVEIYPPKINNNDITRTSFRPPGKGYPQQTVLS